MTRNQDDQDDREREQIERDRDPRDTGIPGDLDHPGVEERIRRYRYVGPQT